jgi:hypothetical protein
MCFKSAFDFIETDLNLVSPHKKTRGRPFGCSTSRVNSMVAPFTESDEILCGIISHVASPCNVMDLKAFNPPAALATPAVALQNFPAELTVSVGIKL